MNYRFRCYQTYLSNIYRVNRSLSKKEYIFFSKVSKKRFKEILPSNKSAKILDIGCGAGHFLFFLQNAGYINAQGIDLSVEQLEAARNMGIKNICNADVFEYLPKYPKYFDMVIANDIIEHLKKDEVLKILDLIRFSLIPRGKALISTINTQSLFGAGLVSIDFTHELGFTPESLQQVMRVCNFVDIKIFGYIPIVHDWRSGLRVLFWKVIKVLIKSYLNIEKGTGRGFWKRKDIFEPKIYAIAKRPNR